MLYFAGKRDAARADAALFNLEKTTQLIQTGIYRHIRHPLYSSLLFVTWGVFLKSLSLTGACLSLVVSVFLAVTAKSEEMENIAFFGTAYKEYIKKSKMFIPFVI